MLTSMMLRRSLQYWRLAEKKNKTKKGKRRCEACSMTIWASSTCFSRYWAAQSAGSAWCFSRCSSVCLLLFYYKPPGCLWGAQKRPAEAPEIWLLATLIPLTLLGMNADRAWMFVTAAQPINCWSHNIETWQSCNLHVHTSCWAHSPCKGVYGQRKFSRLAHRSCWRRASCCSHHAHTFCWRHLPCQHVCGRKLRPPDTPVLLKIGNLMRLSCLHLLFRTSIMSDTPLQYKTKSV